MGDDVAGIDDSRPFISFHLSQESRVYSVEYHVLGVICPAPTAGLSALASPKTVVSGGRQEEGGGGGGSSAAAAERGAGEGGGMSLAVAFVVAYIAAGLAEELAKYFGLARYFLKPSNDAVAEVEAEAGQLPAATAVRGGCGGPAAGWFAPVGNPRVVVYLAFVVGLGFAFTENIQYGVQVYTASAGAYTRPLRAQPEPFL
jgi:hypothetical protein